MAKVRTKTVKRAACKIVSIHYDKLGLDFQQNKKMIVEGRLARIPTKRLRNKVVGYTTRVMHRLNKGQKVRNVTLKLYEEQRAKVENYVPEKSMFDQTKVQVSSKVEEMIEKLNVM